MNNPNPTPLQNNGSDGSDFQKLPPEARQKILETLEKLKAKPGLFGTIGVLGELAKTAKQHGITRLPDLSSLPDSDQLRQFFETGQMPDGSNVQQSTTVTISSNTASTSTLNTAPPPQEQASVNIHRANPKQYQQFNDRRSHQPTFNPDVKGDATRAKLFIIALLILAAYLFYQFGLNGQIPQEWIDGLVKFFE